MARGIGATKSAIGSRSCHETSKDDSGIPYLQKDGFRAKRAWGRPADVLVMPDGALLVSDDSAGVIYRISYRKP